MPVPYVKKLARKHGTTTQRAEGKWAKAKASAASSGHGDNYAYITSIFKNMMHEAPYIPSLKDLTNGMSFKYYLVAEADAEAAPAKERSEAWKHLEKFPQFNELPFKARRELEREAAELVAGYNELEPEEKESVDDHLLDLVIDRLSKEHGGGRGVNIGDWSEPSTPQDDEDVESAIDKWETATGMDAETGEDIVPEKRKRRERAPSHIAAMRGPHAELKTSPEPGALPRAAGETKSYYKPWSALSDEQRAGRAKLAQKHGKIYRVKQAAWFRKLDPEAQQKVIDAIKSTGEIPKM